MRMVLIPFPDVPPVAGVPDLNRLPLAAGVLTGVTPALEGLDYFGFLPGDIPQWILADDQGNALVTPDSVVDLGYPPCVCCFRRIHRNGSHMVFRGCDAARCDGADPAERIVLGVVVPSLRQRDS
ncbi:hypothetical protein WJ542_19195 [Paraburkholderia sp. B3]|uniref:hypothetical protein n=1 Tax=Paraburkholderia sp. B3 TaxID=3134791 RepID=UPI003981CCBC